MNGQVVSARLLQASMSTSSFAPAAAMFGLAGLTATAGSFCLFCENGVGGLPLLTCVSADPATAPAVAATSPVTATTTDRMWDLVIAFLLAWNQNGATDSNARSMTTSGAHRRVCERTTRGSLHGNPPGR